MQGLNPGFLHSRQMLYPLSHQGSPFRIPEFNSWVRGDPLDKEMATHSSILAWEIPCTEEPGRIQSIGVTKELDMI